MPITETAPYAPAATIITLLERYRETGLGGSPITTSIVQKLGAGEEISRRVVLSMKQLELIDDDGVPTANLETFKRASSADYKQLFGSYLLDVYSVVFSILGRDLSSKSAIEIEDAFRDLKPDSLRKRMVTCFIGLCEYAGIVTAPKVRPGPKSTGASVPRNRPPRKRIDTPTPITPSVLPSGSTNGASATAILISGGTVTLTVSVSLVDLNAKDRQFVFDLIDKVKGYGEQPALNAG